MCDLKSEQSKNCHPEKKLVLGSILKEAKNLKNEMSNTLNVVDETIRGIKNDMEHHLFGPRSKNNMTVGKKSASLLINLKQSAESMFTEVATTEYCDLKENLGTDHAHEDIRELRRFHDDIEKIRKTINFVSISIKKINEDTKSITIISNANHDMTQRGTLNSTSASEFSFMAKNRCTSSPIPNTVIYSP